jgi:hypothetical protein
MPESAVPSREATSQPLRLLDVLRERARYIGHSEQTITRYEQWVTSLVRYHRGRHPRALQAPDIGRFLEHIRKTASLGSWLHGVAYRIALKARAQSAARRKHEALPGFITRTGGAECFQLEPSEPY